MRLFFLFSILAGSLPASAQKAYFQQDLQYQIEVKLDDRAHILRGHEEIGYVNRSPDTLRFILMHLWPNAYRNDRTAFTAHQVENGDKDFYYSDAEDRGFIDSLSFTADGQAVSLSEYNNQPDIALLELPEPLAPGQKITLATPFRVVIPEVFSRLGHDGQQYQISQWYPKPAVYDRDGWHPMPYLDQGEFYSEFASYSVKITLPREYVVAATGDLQEEDEKKFIESRIGWTDSMAEKKTAGAASFKTITFLQDRVHDFAWFASKDFAVEHHLADLGEGKKVDCYSFFKTRNREKYKGSAAVTAATVKYLSEHVGTYAYRQVSVVDGKLLAGGGMEYPNVTVIGSISDKDMLKTVIIHEVGHNWFYGMLGSNERDHPWMDEGMNSFYEQRIDRVLQESDSTKTADDSGFAAKIERAFNGSLLYVLNAAQGMDQPIEGPAQEFTSLNYGGVVYKKTAQMLEYLSAYLGDSVFERGMKRYFSEWRFKHPGPDDFRAVMEQESGKNLSWFFEEGLKSSEPIDFVLKRVQPSAHGPVGVLVGSRTRFRGPIPVDERQGDRTVRTGWVSYPYDLPALFGASDQKRSFRIDAEGRLPEVNIANNGKRSFRFGVGTGLGLQPYRSVYALPALGYNAYDGFMLGGVLHNLRLPNERFQFALAPMYAFGSKQLVGSGILGYSVFPRTGALQRVTIGLQGRSFHHASTSLNIPSTLYARHIRYSPFLRFDLRPVTPRTPVSRQVMLQYSGVLAQGFSYIKFAGDSLFRPRVYNADPNGVLRVSYLHRNTRTFHPFSYRIQAEGNGTFAKIGFTGNLRIDYHLRRKSFYARVYGGKFFDFDNARDLIALSRQYLTSTYTAANDAFFEDIYFARNEQSGMLSQQIAMREGGFKISTNRYANPIGRSDNWLAAVNLRSDLPIKLPVKLQVFLDAGTFAQAGKLNPSGNKLLFDAGLELHLLGDALVVYAPLAMSKDFRDYTRSVYTKNRMLQTMSFSLNLAQINWLNTNGVLKWLGL